MSPDELIHRLHEVIDTALWDSFTVEEDRAVGRAESEACEAERREAEAVRDEVTDALRRLADEIEKLRGWKAEALIVLSEWEKTWEAAGRPGPWGGSKAVNVRQEIERLRGEDTP